MMFAQCGVVAAVWEVQRPARLVHMQYSVLECATSRVSCVLLACDVMSYTRRDVHGKLYRVRHTIASRVRAYVGADDGK